jgi:hypothetical protein
MQGTALALGTGSVDQLDLQAIHRVRDRLISRRTAVINQLRAFLLERGLVFCADASEAEGCHGGHPRERGSRSDTTDVQPDTDNGLQRPTDL